MIYFLSLAQVGLNSALFRFFFLISWNKQKSLQDIISCPSSSVGVSREVARNFIDGKNLTIIGSFEKTDSKSRSLMEYTTKFHRV